MRLFKYAPSCYFSPLPQKKCPFCTNDGTLCEFDECPLEIAYFSDDKKKMLEIREDILKEHTEREEYVNSNKEERHESNA